MNTPGMIALRRTAFAITALAWIATVARADVTETRTMSMDLGFGKVDSTTTERISGDKKRTDSTSHCEGFLLSMFCRHMASGEIIRLDKNVRWRLDPKHRSYLETSFPTPEQIAEIQKRRDEILKKLANCPRPAGHASPNTSQCDMSPPQFDIQNTGETATIAGHVARHSVVTMKQTCTKKDTGDACEYVVRIDAWMTEDRIPGASDQRTFREAYDRKMGLDPATMTSLAPQMQQFTAQYASALKQAGEKAKDLRGTPLKTTISISFGGTRCGAAKQHENAGGGVTANAGGAAAAAAENSTSAAGGAAAEQAVTRSTGGSLLGSIAGSAAGAFGHSLLGGLFAKKSTPASPPAAAPASGAVPMVTVFSITTETTDIQSAPIASDEFEVPAGWTRHVPKAVKSPSQFSCPTVGT